MTHTQPAPGSSRLMALAARSRDLLPARSDIVAMGRHPRRDVIAGMTVAVVALPLALGFGITSGLGAEAGIVTAIIAGVLQERPGRP